jgi:hypothetical protein
VVEVKDKDPNPTSESDPKIIENRHIIDANPTTNVATATIQPEEPIDPKDGEHLFHPQMWVKGTPFHFIVDSDNQKNLISAEVVKQLGLSTTPHPCHTTLGGFTGDEIFMSSSSDTCHMASNPSMMR